MTKSQMFNST